MGNLLCKLIWGCSTTLDPVDVTWWFSLSAVKMPGRVYPAAPAPALDPGHSMFHLDSAPLSSGILHPVQEAVPSPTGHGVPLWGCSPYGDAPLQDLEGPSKEAPAICSSFHHVWTLKNHPHPSSREQIFSPTFGSQGCETGTIPLLCPNKMEGKIQQEPRESHGDQWTGQWEHPPQQCRSTTHF